MSMSEASVAICLKQASEDVSVPRISPEYPPHVEVAMTRKNAALRQSVAHK
jgi:hypothetical protein